LFHQGLARFHSEMSFYQTSKHCQSDIYILGVLIMTLGYLDMNTLVSAAEMQIIDSDGGPR
jgi:hypothetical protein